MAAGEGHPRLLRLHRGNAAHDLAAAEWVAWAQAHADDIDPTMTPQKLPGPPAKIPLDELLAFLDGWSPYGPNRR